MIFKIFKIFMVLSFVISLQINAQGKGDATLRKIGFHTGNRVGISFYNDGAITGFRQGVDIRGEWPLGSGENYIGDVTPLIGKLFNQLLFLADLEIGKARRGTQLLAIFGDGIQFQDS